MSKNISYLFASFGCFTACCCSIIYYQQIFTQNCAWHLLRPSLILEAILVKTLFGYQQKFSTATKKRTMPYIMHILKFVNFLMHFYGPIVLIAHFSVKLHFHIDNCNDECIYNANMSYQASCWWCKEWFLLSGTVWWWTRRWFLLENNTLDCSTLWENLLHSVLC